MKPTVIGDCTLYEGDCLEILPVLDDGCADMIFTDPPYGHNNNNGDLISKWEQALGKAPVAESEWRPIANDGEEAETFFSAMVDAAPRLLASGGCCCCCCGGGPDPMFARWSLKMDGPLQFKQMIVWDKGPMGMGWHYRRSYETVLVSQKRGGACKWYSEASNIENIIRPGAYGIRKIIPAKTDHPTPKPPELPAHFIRLHTQRGETVLDPFMGRASTGIAAVTLGRKFIGIEVDAEHFDIACKRIEDAYKQGDFFIEAPKPKAEQTAFDLDAAE